MLAAAGTYLPLQLQKKHVICCAVLPRLFEHLVIQTVGMTALLEYFVSNVCSIRVFEQGSVFICK